MHRHRRAASVEIFGIGGQDLTVLRFNKVAPQPGRMQVAGGECALEGQVIFFAGRQLVEFQNFQPE